MQKLVLETIKAVSSHIISNEDEFMERVCSSSREKQEEGIKSLRRQILRDENRVAELNMLIKRLYEDNVCGKFSDKRFDLMLCEFENEQATLEQSIEKAQAEIKTFGADTVRVDKFIALVQKYTDFSELTPAMLNEFVEKILVHEADCSSGERKQDVEIYLNFIGKFDVRPKELTAEELAESEEQRKRREKKSEYNRRYMAKKRQRENEEDGKRQSIQKAAVETKKGEKIA